MKQEQQNTTQVEKKPKEADKRQNKAEGAKDRLERVLGMKEAGHEVTYQAPDEEHSTRRTPR